MYFLGQPPEQRTGGEHAHGNEPVPARHDPDQERDRQGDQLAPDQTRLRPMRSETRYADGEARQRDLEQLAEDLATAGDEPVPMVRGRLFRITGTAAAFGRVSECHGFVSPRPTIFRPGPA